MKYYFYVENDKIVGKGQAKCLNLTCVEVTQEVYNDYEQDKYIYENGEIVLNPQFEEIKAQEREEQFNKDFFQTSLGYVRRKVSMITGETKDFLSDLLPIISLGVQMGKPVTIITYNKPDFTQETIDWTVLQNEQTVTAEFVQECFMQLSNDFKPVNNNATEENSTEQDSDASSNSSVGLDIVLEEEQPTEPAGVEASVVEENSESV